MCVQRCVCFVCVWFCVFLDVNNCKQSIFNRAMTKGKRGLLVALRRFSIDGAMPDSATVRAVFSDWIASGGPGPDSSAVFSETAAGGVMLFLDCVVALFCHCCCLCVVRCVSRIVLCCLVAVFCCISILIGSCRQCQMW